MDPLSITASLLALAGAVKAGTNGVRKLGNYRKAPRELADLVLELESFQQVLTDIELFTQLYPNAVFNEGLYDCLRRSALKIAAVKDLITSDHSALLRLGHDNRARFMWMRNKHTILNLRDDLKVHRMDLGVRIALVKASSSCRLEESLNVSIGAQRNISDQLSLIVSSLTPSRIPSAMSTGTVTALDLGSSHVEAGLPGFGHELTRARTGEATIERLPAGKMRLSEDRLGQHSNPARNPFHLATKYQCDDWCSCVCHTRSIVKSPWILDAIIGKINVQYTGRRHLCNQSYCHRPTESSLKVVYHPPKYFMGRYVSLVLHCSPLNGPELLLRVPRMVSWSHLLWYYATNGDLLAIQKLFAEGKASPYDINPQGSNALYCTGNRNHSRVLEFLLQQGVDIDQPNEIQRTATDLLWEYRFSGRSGSEGTGIVESTLKSGGRMQTRGFSTLHKIVLGILYKDLESELIASTAEINVGDSRDMTPLCWATIRNDLQAVKTLLKFGADPNISDIWGRTPLYAVRSTDVCKILLDAGVNAHAPGVAYGRSNLHQLWMITGRWCIESDTVDIINLLISAGIEVDVRDVDGQTPLLDAIRSGHTVHTRRFLELGANPNAYNHSMHHSAIHYAVLFDRHDMIPLLLEHGADYTAVDSCGKNIAHMAAWAAGTETASILAESNLVNLDLSLRCNDGKTPADYLSERSILTESEQGLHQEFARFMRSIPASDVEKTGGISRADTMCESADRCDHVHLPGAYPVSADASSFLQT